MRTGYTVCLFSLGVRKFLMTAPTKKDAQKFCDEYMRYRPEADLRIIPQLYFK